MKRARFTPEDDDMIREVYPKFGSTGVLHILDQSRCFPPGRVNRQQVCSRAYLLGVTRDKDWQKRLARVKRGDTVDPLQAPRPRIVDVYPDLVERLAYAQAWL